MTADVTSPTSTEVRTLVPPGHFYSPIVDPAQVERDADRIWADVGDPAGIDFRRESQLEFLRNCLAPHIPDYDYPELRPQGASGSSFYTQNSQFGWLDARTLFAILRHVRPRRMIEVGSGYSSLLTADVNTRFLHGQLDFRCVDPYPREFLREDLVAGLSDVIVEKVQDVDPAMFEALSGGDILFIDSSHVAKTGSDVNHLFLDVLPRLSSGVLIHVHDVFWPSDYPRSWVIEGGRSWNEQYLLQAFLMFNERFEIVFGSNYAATRFPAELSDVLGGQLYGGGSLWMRRR